MAGLVFNEGNMNCKHKNTIEIDEWEKYGLKFAFHYFVTFSLCEKCGRKVLIGGTSTLMNVFDQDRGLESDIFSENARKLISEVIPECEKNDDKDTLAKAYREVIDFCEDLGGCFLEAASVYRGKLEDLSIESYQILKKQKQKLLMH